MSLFTRKPVFRVSDQVRHKPSSTATEDGQRLEILEVDGSYYLCSKNKGQTSCMVTQLVCSSVFAYAEIRFSHDMAQMLSDLHLFADSLLSSENLYFYFIK